MKSILKVVCTMMCHTGVATLYSCLLIIYPMNYAAMNMLVNQQGGKGVHQPTFCPLPQFQAKKKINSHVMRG